MILRVARCKLEKFFRVHYPSENFDAVDDAGAWAREVSAGINQIDFSIARCLEGIETRKASEQFVIAPGKIDIVTAQREHDDLRTRVDHWSACDLRRRPVFAA